jgi:hypothetical protein
MAASIRQLGARVMHGMANRCEPLINVVIDHKPKVLTGLTNRYVAGSGVRSSPDADTQRHRRRGGAYPMLGTHAKRGKPVLLLEYRKVDRKAH